MNASIWHLGKEDARMSNEGEDNQLVQEIRKRIDYLISTNELSDLEKREIALNVLRIMDQAVRLEERK